MKLSIATTADIALQYVVASPFNCRQGPKMRVLTVPPAAVRDENSIEMMRAWIAEKGLHCSLHIGMYEDTQVEIRAWGIMLADLARHVAAAVAESAQGDQAELLSRIFEGLRDELDDPTSGRAGQFVAKPS